MDYGVVNKGYGGLCCESVDLGETANVFKWSYEEVKAWNNKMRATMRDRRYHAYQDLYVVIDII